MIVSLADVLLEILRKRSLCAALVGEQEFSGRLNSMKKSCKELLFLFDVKENVSTTDAVVSVFRFNLQAIFIGQRHLAGKSCFAEVQHVVRQVNGIDLKIKFLLHEECTSPDAASHIKNATAWFQAKFLDEFDGAAPAARADKSSAVNLFVLEDGLVRVLAGIQKGFSCASVVMSQSHFQQLQGAQKKRRSPSGFSIAAVGSPHRPKNHRRDSGWHAEQLPTVSKGDRTWPYT